MITILTLLVMKSRTDKSMDSINFKKPNCGIFLTVCLMLPKNFMIKKQRLEILDLKMCLLMMKDN